MKNNRLKLPQRTFKIYTKKNFTILRVTKKSLWVPKCCWSLKQESVRKGASTHDAALGQ